MTHQCKDTLGHEVGATYQSRYWHDRYRVLDIRHFDDWRGCSVKVLQLDGPSAGRAHWHSTRVGEDTILSRTA